MIDVIRLEELQHEISAMEWDIQNGQFNKRKDAYYKSLLKERDDLLQSKSAKVYEKAASGEAERGEEHDWNEKPEDIQIIRV